MARQSRTVRLTINNLYMKCILKTASDVHGTRSHTKDASRATHAEHEQLVTRKKAHVLNMEQVYTQGLAAPPVPEHKVYILGLPARLGARLLHATMSSKAFRLKVGV